VDETGEVRDHGTEQWDAAKTIENIIKTTRGGERREDVGLLPLSFSMDHGHRLATTRDLVLPGHGDKRSY